MKREIITTNDGSKTIYLPDWNENYHSTHGALQEAIHVFIKSGFEQKIKEHIRILEIGFGSGLNAILTYAAAIEKDKSITYNGLEAFPVSEEERKALDYDRLPEINQHAAILEKLHQVEWERFVEINEHFRLQKIQKKLADFQPDPNSIDLIYFDAFGPRVQPEMWSIEQLSKMYSALDDRGVFVTYCAKGQVRRDLITLGFNVEKIPGPPGKREMLRATKDLSK